MESLNTKVPEKVIMITGGTSGGGFVSAKALAKSEATIILVGKKAEKGKRATHSIREESGNPNVFFWQADLSSMKDVRQVADRFKRTYDRLDVLINYVGATFKHRVLTEDGIEKTFALNYAGVYLLTRLLIDLLQKPEKSRVINVTSSTHKLVRMNFNNLQAERKFRRLKHYGLTSLCVLLFTYKLAEEVREKGIQVNAIHPGNQRRKVMMKNRGVLRSIPPLSKKIKTHFYRPVDLIIYLALAQIGERVTGKYFTLKGIETSSEDSYNKEYQERLWEHSEILTGLKVPVWKEQP